MAIKAPKKNFLFNEINHNNSLKDLEFQNFSRKMEKKPKRMDLTGEYNKVNMSGPYNKQQDENWEVPDTQIEEDSKVEESFRTD
jgi:hypothetical protein